MASQLVPLVYLITCLVLDALKESEINYLQKYQRKRTENLGSLKRYAIVIPCMFYLLGLGKYNLNFSSSSFVIRANIIQF